MHVNVALFGFGEWLLKERQHTESATWAVTIQCHTMAGWAQMWRSTRSSVPYEYRYTAMSGNVTIAKVIGTQPEISRL